MLNENTAVTILSDILKNENISNPKIQISSGSQKGEGFLSCISKVTISDEKKTLHLIVKCAPKNKNLRRMVPLNEVYMREIYFYNKLYPSMKEFQDVKNVYNPFNSVPYCHKTQISEFSELLIMDNICEMGFKLWNCKLRMNDAHIKLGFKEYGKFHATSFALQDQNKELYHNLTKDLYDIIIKFHSDFILNIVSVVDKVKTLFNNDGEEDIQDGLTKLKYEIKPMLQYLAENIPKHNVINHGDCWGNNIMFKYKDDEPTEMKMFDFQLIRAASPAVDLTYFFYANANKEVYKNFDSYLNIYHQSLSAHLLALGSDADKLYPFKLLQNDWRRYSKFGLLMALVVQNNLEREDDEIIDFIDIADGRKDLSEWFLKGTKNESLVNQKMKDLVLHVYNKGFL